MLSMPSEQCAPGSKRREMTATRPGNEHLPPRSVWLIPFLQWTMYCMYFLIHLRSQRASKNNGPFRFVVRMLKYLPDATRTTLTIGTRPLSSLEKKGLWSRRQRVRGGV